MLQPQWLSSFEDKLNNIFFPNKPSSSSNWQEWEDNARKEKPFGYFVTHHFINFIDEYLLYPYYKFVDVVWWLRYRIGSKYTYHKINTGLTPGYYDMDTRMLAGMMEMLVDFVECEKAWMNFDEEIGFFERFNYRDKEAGLKHLEWEMSLGTSPQAEAAREITEIYKWWTEIRPNRSDPTVVSGWSELCDNSIGVGFNNPNETAAERKVRDDTLDKFHDIEIAYEKEEEEMLIRLIRIRRSLWT